MSPQVSGANGDSSIFHDTGRNANDHNQLMPSPLQHASRWRSGLINRETFRTTPPEKHIENHKNTPKEGKEKNEGGERKRKKERGGVVYYAT